MTPWAITTVLVIFGAFLGSMTADLVGVILGGVIGFLLARDINSRKQLARIEELQAWIDAIRQWADEMHGWAAKSYDAKHQSGLEQSERSQSASTAASAPSPVPPSDPVTRVPVTHIPARSVDWQGGEAPRPDPGPLTKLMDAVKAWALTGNVPVKAGVVISLLGMGLLLREANERGIITLTIEMRLIAVALCGLALLVLGWRLQRQRPIYGLSLQGGGIAVLYLTVYAASVVYEVLPSALGASAVIAVTVAAGVLAVVQDARALAVLGIIGGFLAPPLAYSQPDDHILVFGFFAVLTAAIVTLAWFKTWSELNLLGLYFTFGLSSLWLVGFPQDDWAAAQPLVALLAAMYMALPLLFAVRKAPVTTTPWTAQIAFGAPFMTLTLQYLLVGHTEHGMAVSAALLSAVHAVLAVTVRQLARGQRNLAVAYTGLAVAFSAIAVPYALAADHTSMVWAAQGVSLIWFGCRHHRQLTISCGVLMQILAALSFSIYLNDSPLDSSSSASIVDGTLPGAVVLAVASLLSGWMLYRSSDHLIIADSPSGLRFRRRDPSDADRGGGDITAILSWVALIWGTFWWLWGGLTETSRQLPEVRLSVSIVFVVVSFGAAAMASRRAGWPYLNLLGVAILPTLIWGLLIAVTEQTHPLDLYGWVAWPASLAVYYAFLRTREGELPRPVTPALHAGGYWTLAMLTGVEAHWQADKAVMNASRAATDASVWPLTSALITVLVLVGTTLLLMRIAMRSQVENESDSLPGHPTVLLARAWPFGIDTHLRTYTAICTGPVLVVLAVASAHASLAHSGDPSPLSLPYMPVLNPLGVVMVLLMAAAFVWKDLAAPGQAIGVSRHPGVSRYPETGPASVASICNRIAEARWSPALAVGGTVFATMEAARTVHHWLDIPWDFQQLIDSTVLQASLSIIWALIALSGMVLGMRLVRRAVWTAGAGLMTAVVVKLFLVDLASLGAVSRVVSFLGVGFLLLIVGYLAPVPPTASDIASPAPTADPDKHHHLS